MTVNSIQFTGLELKIIAYLFKHYNEKYNARQLARLMKINHAHTNKLCGLLEKKQLLTKEVAGNAIFFSFNYENKLAIKFIQYTLSLEEKQFPKWLVIALHNLKKFNKSIEIGLVFGSAIKNNNFNDIDVLLMYDRKKTKEINKIKKEIRTSQIIEQPIRYVDITEKDLEANKTNKIFYNIISDCLIFHNAEKYVEMVKKCRK